MSFFGRKRELEILSQHYLSTNPTLMAIYGRRRVGKSELIKNFIKNKRHLAFEGLEGESSKKQIAFFARLLKQQITNPLLAKAQFQSWEEIFDFLTDHLKNQKNAGKTVIFLDEFPWMACSQTKLVSLIKFYWDRDWKSLNVMLILCGSVSSYMVRNVIRSNALYGRVNLQLKLEKLKPDECVLLFKKKRSKDEILNYLMLFGGVPKYIEEIDLNISLSKNLQKLAFARDSFFITEFDKIFYSHFREGSLYIRIAHLLALAPLELKDIAENLEIKSGGSLVVSLENMESAGFIKSYSPALLTRKTNLKKYKLTDEYLRFYFKFLEPNKKPIQSLERNNIFTIKVEAKWRPWLGIAFENFCLENAYYIGKLLNIEEQIESFGPIFERGTDGFQIDLVFLRSDKIISVCEIKYHDKPLSADVIAEMDLKIRKLKTPRGYGVEKVLIAPYGVDKKTRNSGYFHQILTLEDLI